MNDINSVKVKKILSICRLFFDRLQLAVTLSSADGRYIYLNPFYLKLRNKKQKELKGLFWWESFATKKENTVIRNHFQAICEVGNYNYHFEYHQDSKSFEVAWSSQLLKLEDDLPLILEIGREIGEEKKLQRQLFYLQKLDSLGNLAAGIAHDFNNLLTTILGYSSYLGEKLERLKIEEVRANLEAIHRTALRAVDMTAKLLGFARKGKYLQTVVELNEIIAGLTEFLRASFPPTIKINLLLDKSIPNIYADAEQIQQSLVNILLNSREAISDSGEIEIRTSWQRFTSEKDCGNFQIPPGEYVQVEIIDNGCGMDERVVNRAFEPFFTTKGSGIGRGMGLAMVYGIIKNHNGYILIDSHLKRGTKITIYFPAYYGNQLITESSQQSRKVKTILIVDDEEEILEFLETILVEEGFSVIKARNGQEAVELFAEKSPELVLIDLIMPVMDGKAAIEKIRELSEQSLIIVMTGYSDSKMIEGVRKAGVSDFAFKPFKIDQLLTMIRSKISSDQGG